MVDVSGARVMSAVAATTITVCLATGLAGCASQISALAPVGGDAMTGVRIAATDVLLERRLSILAAPACTQEAKVVTCQGTLADESTVDVRADVAVTPNTMTVTAGGEVLYQGSVQAILDSAAQATAGVDAQ